jgi:hypothetical protein
MLVGCLFELSDAELRIAGTSCADVQMIIANYFFSLIEFLFRRPAICFDSLCLRFKDLRAMSGKSQGSELRFALC